MNNTKYTNCCMSTVYDRGYDWVRQIDYKRSAYNI